MPQIAIVPPAAPQLTPAGPPAASGSQRFSSHFQEALSPKNKKEQPSPRESRNSDRPDKARGRETSPAASGGKAPQTAPSASPEKDLAGTENTGPAKETTAGSQAPASPQSGEEQATAHAVFVLPSGDTSTGGKFDPSGLGATPEFSKTSSPAQIAAAATSISPSLADETAGAALPRAGQKAAADTMLAQLQQIIENGDEQGAVTITRKGPPPATLAAGSAQPAWLQQVGSSTDRISVAVTSELSDLDAPLLMPGDGWNAPPEKTDRQAASLRQNTQQQYYEAKINQQTFGNNEDSPAKDSRQGNESTAQPQVPSGQAASTAIFLTADQSTAFTQALATIQNTSLPPDTANTVTLPSGTVVREGEIIQQVLERFQISRKQLDTQINIKLHPAELGELKIDLSVKEGLIRANVVAQSQQIQEIIERNLAKLKTALEEHGFTIEAITVTSKSDSTTDADLFNRQFFSRNEHTPQPGKGRQEADAFPLDEAFFPAQPATTGVNVKI